MDWRKPTKEKQIASAGSLYKEHDSPYSQNNTSTLEYKFGDEHKKSWCKPKKARYRVPIICDWHRAYLQGIIYGIEQFLRHRNLNELSVVVRSIPDNEAKSEIAHDIAFAIGLLWEKDKNGDMRFAADRSKMSWSKFDIVKQRLLRERLCSILRRPNLEAVPKKLRFDAAKEKFFGRVSSA